MVLPSFFSLIPVSPAAESVFISKKYLHKAVSTIRLLRSLHTGFCPSTITMVSTKPLLVAATLFAGSFCNTLTTPSQAQIVHNAYIVELKSTGGLSKRASDLHEEFHELAKRDAAVDYTIRQNFSSESVFVGLSITLNSGNAQNIEDLDNVANVYPIRRIPSPSAVIRSSPIQAREASYSTVPVPGTNYTLPYITGALDVNRPHTMTGVDKAHSAGIKGKGMKIAIVDTGVDYRHPSLGGCFGTGCKISFGYDFVGDGYDPGYGGLPVESPEPLTTCHTGGHGTHVTGKSL